MDSRKLERILLLILALLNVFLLAVVLSDSAQTRRSEAETAARLTEMLARSGIRAEEDAVRLRAAPSPCTLTRDLTAEQRLISRLVGEARPVELGGNIVTYAGARGQAQMRGSGETDILMEPGAVPVRRGMARTAQRLLRDAGIRTRLVGEEVPEREELTLCATLDGYPVYNALLTVEFSGDSVYMITGTRLFDAVTRDDAADTLDSVTVLIRFLDLVGEGGYVCSRIDAVEPGYLQSVLRSGETALAPVWRIVTDAGAFLIDAATGEPV